MLFAVLTSPSLVSLLLLGSTGVAQFFPGVVLGLFSKRVTTVGIFSGMVVGIAITALLILTGRDPYNGLNAGFIALCVNFVVTGLVSLLTTVRVSGFEQVTPALAASAASGAEPV
jgi:SSS family solute:Na+ symporter